MPIMTTISATVPTDVKTKVATLAKAHGTTTTALVREMLACIAAGDRETLAWVEQAGREQTPQCQGGASQAQ